MYAHPLKSNLSNEAAQDRIIAMHLASNNERQRRYVVDARNASLLSRCQIRQRERDIQGKKEREREGGEEAEHEEQGEQTASQIGFIVRLMKAITRGRVVPRARGIVKRKGSVGCIASRTHACTRGDDIYPFRREERTGEETVARPNNVTHRSSAFAN